MLISFFLPGHTDSWWIQWEVPKAVEDMGWKTSSVLFPCVPDHKLHCVFLVPAGTVHGAAYIVSSLHNIPIIVSVQDGNSGFILNVTTVWLMTLSFFLLPWRVWLLRKLLIIIFTRRTERNSKIIFALYTYCAG